MPPRTVHVNVPEGGGSSAWKTWRPRIVSHTGGALNRQPFGFPSAPLCMVVPSLASLANHHALIGKTQYHTIPNPGLLVKDNVRSHPRRDGGRIDSFDDPARARHCRGGALQRRTRPPALRCWYEASTILYCPLFCTFDSCEVLSGGDIMQNALSTTCDGAYLDIATVVAVCLSVCCLPD